jgi:predicted DNA-binding transcriptional regulator YafY
VLPGRVERIDAYRCRVQLGADSLDTLAQEILAFGADVEVDGPLELIEHLHAVGRRLLAAGAGGPDQRAGGAGIAPSRSNG